MNLLKNFRNVDLAGSNGVDLDEFISVVQNIQKESENKNIISLDEIKNILSRYFEFNF